MNDKTYLPAIRHGLLWACALLGTQAATAKTVCVNPAGGKCQPTLAAGIATAAAGDTVTLAPGVYYEEGIIIDKPLTLKGSAKAIIDAGKIPDPADTTPPVALIHGSKHALLIGANDVTIEGITIRNSQVNGIELINSAGGAVINKVSIYNAGGYCINGAQLHHNVSISGSTLRSCKLSGINLTGNQITVAKNRLGHLQLRGIYVNGNGATLVQNQIGSSSSHAIRVSGHDALIQNNAINAGSDEGISVTGDNPLIIGNVVSAVAGQGVYLDCPNNCSSARIAKNKLTGIGGYEGIYATPNASGLLIESNAVTGAVWTGVHALGDATVADNKIVNAGVNGFSCILVEEGSHLVMANQLLDCAAAGIEAYGHNTTIIGNTVNRAGTAGIFAAADNMRVENNKISNSSGFGVITGYDNNSIFLTHNQLKDNRDAICDAAVGTTISGNSGNGKVWDVGTSFGTQGVDGCEFLFN